jgi:hypothetical protein
MKNRSKICLKTLFTGLALGMAMIASLGLVNPAHATHQAPSQTEIKASQPTPAKHVAVLHLAWQRVGAPISIES